MIVLSRGAELVPRANYQPTLPAAGNISAAGIVFAFRFGRGIYENIVYFSGMEIAQAYKTSEAPI